jgi:3-hydroxyacyl-CoA dehydrogenase
MALITPTDYDALKDADIVIEAVFEDMDIKKDVFTKLDAVAKPGAILATNTSTSTSTRSPPSPSGPQDVIGLHFFSRPTS